MMIFFNDNFPHVLTARRSLRTYDVRNFTCLCAAKSKVANTNMGTKVQKNSDNLLLKMIFSLIIL